MSKFPDFLVTISDDKKNIKKVSVSLKIALGAQANNHPTAIFLILDGVNIIKKGYLDHVDVGPPFKPAKEELDKFIKNGGKIYVAKACFKHDGLKVENCIEGIEIVEIDTVISLLSQAKTNFKL